VIRNIVRYSVYDSYSYDDRWAYPSYASYFYDTPYEPVYGAPLVDNCLYYGIPSGYYQPQVSYVYVPQYGAAYYDPYYYEPNYVSYPSYTAYSDYDYYPTYSNYGYPSYEDEYAYYDSGYGYEPYSNAISQLPVGDLLSEFAGNGFLSELLGGFLSQAYDQGYLDGQYAREIGYTEDEYYDPYAYHTTSYDTYSLNLAENRRIFSEGYEAGYRDAMAARQDEYYPQEESQPNLIGLLVGNVISGV
jgi:hypothetical protein